MLPKNRRMGKDLFRTLSGRGFTLSSPLFSIRISPLPDKQAPSAFTVVISAKTASLAVDRNRLKRRIRAIIQNHLESFVLGWGVAIMCKKPATMVSLAELDQELGQLFNQAKIIKS